MGFYYSRRKLRPREEDEGNELNIVPYLDILMNLIIFMLLSMTGLAAFGILNVSAPNYGGPSAAVAPETADTPKLLLTVLVSKKGFFVAGTGAVPGPEGGGQQPTPNLSGEPTIPKQGGSYDFVALTSRMVEIKKAFPEESKVIIGAESDISYEILIQTMDALRELPGRERKILFPDVTLAAL
jgi:biopolymer transport protein ExbD